MVAIPNVIAPVVQWHLACFASDGDEEVIFTSPKANRCTTGTSGAAYGYMGTGLAAR
jgi:hypothetical protein